MMNFDTVDRMPFMEWIIWRDKTLDRWHQEGRDASLWRKRSTDREKGSQT